MRWSVVLLTTLLALAGCESKEQPTTEPTASSDAAPAPSPPSVQGGLDEQKKAVAEMLRASTRATKPPTSREVDPLESPESAVKYLFQVIEKGNNRELRSILVEPPSDSQLQALTTRIRRQFSRGTKWQIVDSFTRNTTASVIYRTTYPSGRNQYAPVALIKRYDRWKLVIGELTPKLMTPAEKADLIAATYWTQNRLNALHGVTTRPATRSASQPATHP